MCSGNRTPPHVDLGNGGGVGVEVGFSIGFEDRVAVAVFKVRVKKGH